VLAAKPANKPAAAAAPVTRPAPPAARAQPADGARAAAAVAPARGRSAEAAAVQGMARAPDPAAAAEAPPNAAPPLPLGTPPGPSRLPPGIDPTISSPADVAAIAAPALALPLPDLAATQAPEEPDRGLELAESVDPRFPIPLMTRLRKGQVEVRFEVAADGHVESASVERSTHRGLEAAALDAVRQWRFKPGPRGHTALVDLAFDMDS
jgi:protein TonB